MATLTIRKYHGVNYNFAKLVATVTGDDVDTDVFVVRDMPDPMSADNTVTYLMAIASRVDMSEYTDAPVEPGDIYRTSSVTLVMEHANELDDVADAIILDVAINVETIQRQPLETLQDIWIPERPPPEVVAVNVFYYGSVWSSSSNDAAIAPDKTALLPGGTGAFANVISYTKGITGIMLDVVNIDGVPTADDFSFKVGNDDSPSGWVAAAAPASIAVRSGAGVDGSDRVDVTWANDAIKNTWLEVVASFASNHRFYYGNLVAETGNAEDPLEVTINDRDYIIANTTSSGAAGIDNVYDVTRDASVNASDVLAASGGMGMSLNPIQPPL